MRAANQNQPSPEYRAVQRAAWLVIAGSCGMCFAAAIIGVFVY